MSGKFVRSLSAVALFVTAVAGHANVLISQVYGGGGNSGAIYQNDFIERFNAGSSPQRLSGWSVQYASVTGTAVWVVSPLTSVTRQPGQYYLIQQASDGAVGAVLPPSDAATGPSNLSATSGKVVLVNSTTALTGVCPSTGCSTKGVTAPPIVPKVAPLPPEAMR